MIYTVIFPTKIVWCYGNKCDINTCLCFDNYSLCSLPSIIGIKNHYRTVLEHIVYLPYDMNVRLLPVLITFLRENKLAIDYNGFYHRVSL